MKQPRELRVSPLDGTVSDLCLPEKRQNAHTKPIINRALFYIRSEEIAVAGNDT
jgi:hypothetical protein